MSYFYLPKLTSGTMTPYRPVRLTFPLFNLYNSSVVFVAKAERQFSTRTLREVQLFLLGHVARWNRLMFCVVRVTIANCSTYVDNRDAAGLLYLINSTCGPTTCSGCTNIRDQNGKAVTMHDVINGGMRWFRSREVRPKYCYTNMTSWPLIIFRWTPLIFAAVWLLRILIVS